VCCLIDKDTRKVEKDTNAWMFVKSIIPSTKKQSTNQFRRGGRNNSSSSKYDDVDDFSQYDLLNDLMGDGNEDKEKIGKRDLGDDFIFDGMDDEFVNPL